jgi:hypothetical protein
VLYLGGVVTEIELDQIAVQVLRAMLVNARFTSAPQSGSRPRRPLPDRHFRVSRTPRYFAAWQRAAESTGRSLTETAQWLRNGVP